MPPYDIDNCRIETDDPALFIQVKISVYEKQEESLTRYRFMEISGYLRGNFTFWATPMRLAIHFRDQAERVALTWKSHR